MSDATVDRLRLSYYSTSDGSLHVELEADRNGLALVVALSALLVLLLFDAGMAFALVSGLAREGLVLSTIAGIFVVIAGTTFLIYKLARGVLWTLYGIERVSIGPGIVVYARSDGWTGSVRRYESAKLADLRWEKDSKPGSSRVEPAIQFYYGAETVSVFLGTEKPEAMRVIALVEERLGRQVGPIDYERGTVQ